MRFEPESYQQEIKNFLLTHKVAYLMVGMSLGKTASTLAALDQLFKDWAIKGALIVAPLRVTNLVWPLEVAKWDQFRWMRIANLRTAEGRQMLKDGTAHLYCVNYEMLPKLAEWIKGRRAKAMPFDTVVWDEITMGKSHTSVRVNSMRKKLRKICSRHWGLTGTPAPNSYLDLFGQVRLLDGGKRFGPSYHLFRDNFFEPIDFHKRKWELRPGGKDHIHERIKDISLSMQTSDYLDLPDMVVEDVEITLPKKAQELYNELEEEFFIELDKGEEVVAVNMAVLVGKLQQITSGAIYTDEEHHYSILHEQKIKTVQKLLKGTGNTLVVYNFRHELDRLRKALKGAIPFELAKTEKEQRSLCERWNKGEIKALLVHPKSMSHGLNLQGGGSDVIWTSIPYSREQYDQLNRRVCRRGQEKQTTIYRILASNTIDYAVTNVLRSKGDRQDALFSAMKLIKQSKKGD